MIATAPRGLAANVGGTHAQPQQVNAAATRGDDAHAREGLAMFCAMLGGFAGGPHFWVTDGTNVA